MTEKDEGRAATAHGRAAISVAAAMQAEGRLTKTSAA
jgi:hypothetical protein